jgi:hypothetical protein
MSDARPPDDTPRWQPIDTAPKDGTWIWCVEADIACKTNPTQYAMRWCDQRNAGWYDDYNGQCDPTHWMPLPEPPNV